ncbi:MAG: YfhO family protein [Planctomycetaceae bacterium]|nr:YfhO family protein [Planctomycetaceae bacterium]
MVIVLFFCFNGGVPAFRDGVHYYRPLFWYLCGEIELGRLPLWNPYENLGQPLAADPTSLCFYPVMIFAVIASVLGMNRDFAYSICVGFHILLAAVTCYRFIRLNRLSREAGVFAGLSYALGGVVIFQWNNLPFLIGAAWLPEALSQAKIIIDANKSNSSNSVYRKGGICSLFDLDQFSYKNSADIRFNVIAFAIVLSMMILGGDIQTAYNVVICVVVMILILSKYKFQALIYFFIAGIFTFMFSAILILPAIELWQLSDRTLIQHSDSIERFSFHPLRVLEFLFTGIGGKLCPVNAGIFAAFLKEKNLWTPSAYLGLLPAIFALCAIISVLISAIVRFRCRRFSKQIRYKMILAAIIILTFFLFASFGGNFFVYSVLRKFPIYNSFRYPSKLLVFAAVGISFLSAVGFDTFRLNRRFAKLTIIMLRIIVTIYIVFVIFVCFNGFPKFESHPLFGLFDAEKARNHLIVSVIIVTIIVILVEFNYRYIFIDCVNKSRLALRRKISGWILVIIVTVDLFVVNSWMMISTPFSRNDTKSLTLKLIESDTNDLLAIKAVDGGSRNFPIRVYRDYPFRYPSRFMESSLDRFEEIISWEKLTLYPRYSFLAKVGLSNVRGSVMHKDYYAAMSQVSAERKIVENRDAAGLFESHLEQLGVKYIIAERDSFVKNRDFKADKIIIDLKNIDGEDIRFPLEFSIWRLRNPKLREYILYEPNRIIFDVNVREETETIMLTEQYWKGWRAFDGDVEIPIKPVRKIFRAVELSKGKHRITMIYDPLLIKLGGLIAFIGILSAIIFCVFFPINLWRV